MVQRMIVACFLVIAVAASAAPVPQDNQQPVPPAAQGSTGELQVTPTPTIPPLDVNAAELADGREAPAVPAGGEDAQGRELPADLREPTNPLAPQFQAVLAEERQQLQALNEEFARATDEQAAMTIQQRIRAVKLQTERRLLEIQLAAARSSGDEQRIAVLEEAVAALDAPRPAPIHVERDVPDVHQH